MNEPLTPAEIAELQGYLKSNMWPTTCTLARLLDSHETLRQRADAGVRAGMERLLEMEISEPMLHAYNKALRHLISSFEKEERAARWPKSIRGGYKVTPLEKARCRFRAMIRAALPVAAAKDEVR